MTVTHKTGKSSKQRGLGNPRAMEEREIRGLVNKILALAKKSGAEDAEVHID